MWSWRDRIIGIVVGVVLGVGVIVAFVFFVSGETVDAPSLSGSRPAQRAEPRSSTAPGFPPVGGPKPRGEPGGR